MPSKAEKDRRRAMVRDIRDREHADAEARMPISKADLRELFGLLDSTLFERRGAQTWCHCDDTLRRTREFLRSRSLDQEIVATWLGEYGGRCDCGVAANVANYWARHVGC